jgi:hypothetical protein
VMLRVAPVDEVEIEAEVAQRAKTERRRAPCGTDRRG